MKGAQKWIGEKLNWNLNKMRTIFHLPFTLHNFPLPPLTRSAFFSRHLREKRLILGPPVSHSLNRHDSERSETQEWKWRLADSILGPVWFVCDFMPFFLPSLGFDSKFCSYFRGKVFLCFLLFTVNHFSLIIISQCFAVMRLLDRSLFWEKSYQIWIYSFIYLYAAHY